MCCSVLPCVAGIGCELRKVVGGAVRCSVLQCVSVCRRTNLWTAKGYSYTFVYKYTFIIYIHIHTWASGAESCACGWVMPYVEFLTFWRSSSWHLDDCRQMDAHNELMSLRKVPPIADRMAQNLDSIPNNFHRILRVFLTTFNLVSGVPGFSWDLSLVP